METIRFYKYHGTGNDFILIDNRDNQLPGLKPSQIAHLCHRRFGIGADGLILLETTRDSDFLMRYYNADGGESSMCGNGGRCIAAFASRLGLVSNDMLFTAVDGPHDARILDKNGTDTIVSLRMKDVSSVSFDNDRYILDTGSPHMVIFSPEIKKVDVENEGRKIRNSAPFVKAGINVNFVQNGPGIPAMRTYERGVEAETWSCGTGTIAVALALNRANNSGNQGTTVIDTPGGQLEVRFKRNGDGYSDIWLTGPATFVFEGTFNLLDVI